MLVIVNGEAPPLLNVTVCAALVAAGEGRNLVLFSVRLAGVNEAAATGLSAGAVQGADGPPTTPGPFSKIVASVRASGKRPSQWARDSEPGNTVPVGLVPPTARSTSLAVRPVYVAVHFVEPGAS